MALFGLVSEPDIPDQTLGHYESDPGLGLNVHAARSFHVYQKHLFDPFECLSAENHVVVLAGERKVEAMGRSIRDIARDIVRQ